SFRTRRFTPHRTSRGVYSSTTASLGVPSLRRCLRSLLNMGQRGLGSRRSPRTSTLGSYSPVLRADRWWRSRAPPVRGSMYRSIPLGSLPRLTRLEMILLTVATKAPPTLGPPPLDLLPGLLPLRPQAL